MTAKTTSGKRRAKAAATAVSETTVTKIVAYKGFNSLLQCSPNGTPFQFEIGKSYEVEGPVKACKNGFHACESPLSVFGYYPPVSNQSINRFAEVLIEGDMNRDGDKIAARKITIVREITIKEMTEKAVALTIERATKQDEATGDYGASSATGYRGASSATGYRGASSATGDYGASSATGYRGASSAIGDYGASSATGDHGASSATGTQGASSATGDYGASSATGYRGASSATGYRGASSATGKFSSAMATGFGGRVLGADGCALFLVERSEESGDNFGKIIAVWAGIAGQDGVKPDTFYTLKNGQPVEVTE